MIVITRNGKTTIYEGWRAWLLVGTAIILTWLVFTAIALIVVGTAITFGIAMLLLVPTLIVVWLIGFVMRRMRHDA